MLTAIRSGVRSARARPARPPTEHATRSRARTQATYDMICRADTVGVFQIEIRAQMSMLPRLQAAQVLRPGDRGRDRAPRPDQGRHGASLSAARQRKARSRSTTRARSSGRCCRRRCGVPIFQEQVMQIAVVAAGFTPGEADQLRRAMGAWQRSGEIEHVPARSSWTGMRANGYSRRIRRADLQADRGLRRIWLSRIRIRRRSRCWSTFRAG